MESTGLSKRLGLRAPKGACGPAERIKMFVPLDKQPEAVQRRGDRISIFRADAERLLNLPDSALAMLLRALFQWFKDGSDAHLDDPMADCCLQSLKEAQLRIVDEVWRKHETNKANRAKAGRTTSDGRPRSSTVSHGCGQSSPADDGRRQAQAEAKALAKTESESKATSIKPTLEEVIAWGKSEMISEEFLRDAYSKASAGGWTSSKGAISSWRKYFKAWSDRVGGGVKEWHNRMLDEMNETERSTWSDSRRARALRYFAQKHNRQMVQSESGAYWPAPFDWTNEMQLAYKEYDEAADRGEVDLYYRSRYYDVCGVPAASPAVSL